MPDIKISSNQILKDGKTIICLPAEAIEVLPVDNLIVVLFKKEKADNDRNILCYEFDGTFKWQAPVPFKLHADNYFVGLELRDNQLFAYSISGIEYHLDLNTGDVLESQLVK